ncbi:hypothetical protein Mal4_19370 [Maioricimonas rarisocia]|uniref:Uncharacterized protein n=1 Tax=Maioricimonas rarisocia TaxID=2528026 RepID=A0A517Z555_9PLAN|nr:hypothetical protein Mal4_19370 [Maioricimonas rarisocia]
MLIREGGETVVVPAPLQMAKSLSERDRIVDEYAVKCKRTINEPRHGGSSNFPDPRIDCTEEKFRAILSGCELAVDSDRQAPWQWSDRSRQPVRQHCHKA